MYWFSSERSKRYVDKAVKRLYSFQKVFAVFALVILLTGTFLSPILYAIRNDEIIEELIDNNDLEEQENIEYFDMELSEIPIEAEVVDLRSPNEKVFKKIDGSYEIAMYSDVVHYLNEEGKFTDIDNTIIEQNNEYINKDNLFNISFPKTLNANKEVKLVIDDYEINWRLNNSITSKAVRRNGTINETDKQDLIKTTSSVIYKNALPNVDVEYVLTGSKIKENIYINKYNKNLNLVFDYNVKNLDLIKTELGELVFINDEN